MKKLLLSIILLVCFKIGAFAAIDGFTASSALTNYPEFSGLNQIAGLKNTGVNFNNFSQYSPFATALISSQPTDQAACAGSSATFSIVASDAVSYQWQVNQGSGFVNIVNDAQYANSTTNTLTITGATASMNGYLYRSIATGSTGPAATSDNAKLSVFSGAVSIPFHPIDRSICAGEVTTFQIGALNASSYQWQVDQHDGAGFNIIPEGGAYANVATSTLTITAAATAGMNGYSYRCVASGPCSMPVTSQPASLSVSIPPFISSSPSNATVCEESATTFSVYSINASTFQWQVDDGSGAGFTNVANGGPYSGARTPVLTVTALANMNGYRYRCTAGNACQPSPAISGSATLSVNSKVITPSQTNLTCNGANNGAASVVVTGGTGSFSYDWAPGTPTGDGTPSITGLSAGTYSVIVTDTNTGCATTKTFTITQPTALTATATSTNVTCNGSNNGSATVTAAGGTLPYTYVWSAGGSTSNTATGLAPGTYSVTITDANGCSASQSVTITQPVALTATAVQTNVTCNTNADGTATVTVNGGTLPYTYSWSAGGSTTNSATGLAPGLYTVNITDASGCATSQSVTITEPAALTATAVQTNVTCNGNADGTATVTVNGGTLPYTYSWSAGGSTTNSATGLAPGSYTVNIRDAKGCTTSQSINITEPAALTATAVQTNVTCNSNNDGTATVTATGGTLPYTYSWSAGGSTTNSSTGLAPGTYTVNITDAKGCTTSQSVTITEPAALTASIAQTNVTCNNNADGTATVSVTGGTLPYTYSWSAGGSTTNSATGLAPGNYTVNITDAKGCTTSQSVAITQPAVLTASISSQTNVSCFGDTNGAATVNVTGGTAPYTYSWTSGGTAATATGLGANSYTVTITDAKGCTTSQSVTITEPALLTATAAQTNVTCNGNADGTATVTVNGGTLPYTYSWSAGGSTTNSANGLAPGTYTVNITDAKGCTNSQSITITQPAALTASEVHTNVTCNTNADGTATVTVTGGTTPYTYSWSAGGSTTNSAAGLAPGIYTVNITDAKGCTTSQSITITEPAALTASIASQTNVSCNGGNNGSATVSANGGTAPYTYSWPSGVTTAAATGLIAGSYTVTITDANNCTQQQNVTITEPAALAITANQTSVSCNGGNNGSASVNVTGGTAPYTYSWTSGSTAASATNLIAGTYTVTITDANNCSKTQDITISQPAALSATASQTNVSTPGGNDGSATVNVSGGTAPYTYSWSPAGGTSATASGLSSGAYTCTITDSNGCSTTVNVNITEVPVLTAPAAVTMTYGDAPFVITPPTSASSGAFTYTSSDPQVASINGSTVTILKVGTTTITATQAASGKYSEGTITTVYTIVPKNITVGLNATPLISKEYDGTTAATLANANYSLNGLIAGDAVTVSSTATYNSSVAANGKTITVNSFVLAGAQKDNYNLTTVSATTTGNITKKDLTLALNAAPAISKVYDGTTAATLVPANYTLNTLVAGDDVSVTGTAVYDSKNAGSNKVITVNNLVLSGAQKDNYNLTTTSQTTTGSITPKAISASFAAVSKVYDGTTNATVSFNAFTTADGLVGSDDLKVIYTAANYNDKNVGAGKAISFTGLASSGADKNNYTLNNLTVTGSITTKAITVTANAISKTYGDADPQLSYAITSGSIAAGDTFSGSLTRAAGESIGTYAITQGSLALSTNYVLSFTGASFTIVKKELIISADNKTRFFGSANPALTLSYSGFVNGDDKAVLSPAASVSTSATITSPLGDYPITVSGAAAANYSITYKNGILTVIPGTPTAINLAPATLFENRPAGSAAGTLSSTSDDANATFSFSLVSGAGDTDNSLFSINGDQVKTTASLDYENKSSYSVRVRSTTQHGFLLEKVITISLSDVNEIPTMAVIADQSFCYSNSPLMMTVAGVTAGPEGSKQTTALTASSSNKALFSDIKINGNQVSYQIAKGQSGSSTITLTVRDNGGTDNGGVDTYSRTFNVTVKAPLQIAITSDKGTTIGKGETLHLTATGGVKYSWTSANGIISGQQSSILTIRPSETTTYKVRVTNAEGCEDEQTLTIVATDDYQLVQGANIITPNGDGINDRLEIKNIDMYPKGELKIFDRAGRLIYSTINYKNDWDGTFQGSLLAEGTYYYIVDFGPGIGKKKGFLSIVRD